VWKDRLLGADPSLEGEEIDPRLSFANERTYLAWTRTALALISIGLATQLLPEFDVRGGRQIIGVPCIVAGIAVAIASLRGWAERERAMRLGRPLPRSALGLGLTALLCAVAVVALILVLVGGDG
jgi:putative membrane protein